MIAHMTKLTWALLMVVCCTPTPAHSRSVVAAAAGETERDESPGPVSHEGERPSSHQVVFPGTCTCPHHHHHQPLTAPSMNRYPTWPARHLNPVLSLFPDSESEGDEREGVSREPSVGARRQRHLPLVQARHQINNPWRQLQQMGYMLRGRPQTRSSVWYWD